MDPLNEEISLAWESISSNSEELGWNTIPVSRVGGVEIDAGRKSPGNLEAIIFRFDNLTISPRERLPEGQGFCVERVSDANDEVATISLSRKAQGSIEFFAAMAFDVVKIVNLAADEIDNTPTMFKNFLARVCAWQEFMKKGASPLTPEKEVGLVGEILLLNELLLAGISPEMAVTAWVAPTSEGTRDFVLGYGAIEVKTTISDDNFIAKIGSLEQLDDSVEKPLYICATRITQTENGVTLPMIIDQIRKSLDSFGKAKLSFENRLMAAEYIEMHIAHYQRKYKMVEIRYLEVKDNFPRLILGNVPSGVVSVKYDINLQSILQCDVGLENVLTKLDIFKK